MCSVINFDINITKKQMSLFSERNANWTCPKLSWPLTTKQQKWPANKGLHIDLLCWKGVGRLKSGSVSAIACFREAKTKNSIIKHLFFDGSCISLQDKFENIFLVDVRSSVFWVSLEFVRRYEDAVNFPGTLNNFFIWCGRWHKNSEPANILTFWFDSRPRD